MQNITFYKKQLRKLWFEVFINPTKRNIRDLKEMYKQYKTAGGKLTLKEVTGH